MFLARSELPPGKLVEAMEGALSDQGLDAVESRVRLQDLLDVQNTYLSTFQSLGALGLLLGTFGLATVQLRSVLERRGELALMRAAGFRRRRLAEMVMIENAVLLAGGLCVGLLAALLAVLPHWWAGGAEVPLADLAIYLGIVLIVGLVSGLAAVRATLRAPLLAALRGG
jgi:ABC-type antimicrobial peptide transport system permease subunit